MVVPAGSFVHGFGDGIREPGAPREGISKPFAIGRYQVTFGEWDSAWTMEGVLASTR